MGHAARKLIDSFATLPPSEQQEVLSELLKRVIDQPYSAPSNDELLHVADAIFQDYDRRENPQQ